MNEGRDIHIHRHNTHTHTQLQIPSKHLSYDSPQENILFLAIAILRYFVCDNSLVSSMYGHDRREFESLQ